MKLFDKGVVNLQNWFIVVSCNKKFGFVFLGGICVIKLSNSLLLENNIFIFWGQINRGNVSEWFKATE